VQDLEDLDIPDVDWILIIEKEVYTGNPPTWYIQILIAIGCLPKTRAQQLPHPVHNWKGDPDYGKPYIL